MAHDHGRSAVAAGVGRGGEDLFHRRAAQAQRPQSLLAETDQPQVQINRETMARFRPEMRKFYYDASKYDTYLDQLGVKFPQLTKPQ